MQNLLSGLCSCWSGFGDFTVSSIRGATSSSFRRG